MGRGPTVRQEEVDKAHQLKAEGKKPREIAKEMNRSVPTVYKLLYTQPVNNESPSTSA